MLPIDLILNQFNKAKSINSKMHYYCNDFQFHCLNSTIRYNYRNDSNLDTNDLVH